MNYIIMHMLYNTLPKQDKAEISEKKSCAGNKLYFKIKTFFKQ